MRSVVCDGASARCRMSMPSSSGCARSLGVTCEQDKCDAGSRDSVEALVVKCEGRISGIIHSAGVLQDSMLQNQTWEKFCAVFQPKSKAALYFHDALERHANPLLAFFWMFSSVAVYGNMGQTPYSASNAALDGLGAGAGPAVVLGTDVLRLRPRMLFTKDKVYV